MYVKYNGLVISADWSWMRTSILTGDRTLSAYTCSLFSYPVIPEIFRESLNMTPSLQTFSTTAAVWKISTRVRKYVLSLLNKSLRKNNKN